MPRAIALELPYPSVELVEEDRNSACIISPSYAGMHGELSAILQYIYHSFYFEKYCEKEIAETLTGIALAEMRHFDILGTLILKLGVDPVYTLNPPGKYNFYNTSAIAYSKCKQKMLMDDIAGELLAIEEYSKILCRLENEQVSAIIARIKLDEELHVKVLKEQLEKLICSEKERK